MIPRTAADGQPFPLHITNRFGLSDGESPFESLPFHFRNEAGVE
jgi:hypothetical protein